MHHGDEVAVGVVVVGEVVDVEDALQVVVGRVGLHAGLAHLVGDSLPAYPGLLVELERNSWLPIATTMPPCMSWRTQTSLRT